MKIYGASNIWMNIYGAANICMNIDGASNICMSIYSASNICMSIYRASNIWALNYGLIVQNYVTGLYYRLYYGITLRNYPVKSNQCTRRFRTTSESYELCVQFWTLQINITFSSSSHNATDDGEMRPINGKDGLSAHTSLYSPRIHKRMLKFLTEIRSK